MIPKILIFVLSAAAAQPLPIAPPPRPAGLGLLPGADPSIADWTPRPALGHFEPWERATDKDWIDPRFREMDTGPFLGCTMRYPFGKGQQTVYKAVAVKLGPKGEAAAVFDRSTLRLSAAWTGGFLNHSDRRFGLLNTPTPKGEMLFAAPAAPGWADPNGNWDTKETRFTAPLPKEWAKYRGLYVHGDRVVLSYTVGDREVLETVKLAASAKGRSALVRTAIVGPGKKAIEWAGDASGQRATVFAASDAPLTSVRNYGGATELEDSPAALTKGGPKRWGEPIVTKLEQGDARGPFTVDTITIPYKNRFGVLFFCTGLDFLPDGRIAVCTCHGDVWLITVDDRAGTCSWQRYATGLYQPLGLRVVDGKVIVLERGQLTRLHDLNNDGEADFYECVNNDWHTGGGEHSYDTCLETDPQGNFYFFKTGDTETPTGGCLIRVSKDGSMSEVYCTGFRHPIGLGMSPTGVLTGADQEGNWMPATRIDEYKKGGFYGDMRAHHRATPPTTFDPPLCWLPREVDNSAGGQVWVPGDAKAWGSLAGMPLHLSFGRCKAFVLLRQELPEGGVQGGATALPLNFLSGACRGRFAPDGSLYVCGLNGWQTAARADGSLQRVRPSGKPLDVPVGLEVKGNTVRLTFSHPIDEKTVTAANFRAAWWNYHWNGEYGSKRYKVSDPRAEGQDDVTVRSATLSGDGRTIELTFTEVKPVMQMMVGFNVKSADGRPVVGSVYLTVHSTGK
jgi:hypothetical protein